MLKKDKKKKDKGDKKEKKKNRDKSEKKLKVKNLFENNGPGSNVDLNQEDDEDIDNVIKQQ